MASDVDWIENKLDLKNKRGAIRYFGYIGLLSYAILRVIVMFVVFIILVPVIWIKEKLI